jgi:hypothetical protein
MNRGVWINKFKPTTEDYIEIEDVKKGCLKNTDMKYVWTLVDDDNIWYIIPGYHLVNRIGYFVTKEPWQEDSRSVRY